MNTFATTTQHAARVVEPDLRSEELGALRHWGLAAASVACRSVGRRRVREQFGSRAVLRRAEPPHGGVLESRAPRGRARLFHARKRTQNDSPAAQVALDQTRAASALDQRRPAAWPLSPRCHSRPRVENAGRLADDADDVLVDRSDLVTHPTFNAVGGRASLAVLDRHEHNNATRPARFSLGVSRNGGAPRTHAGMRPL